MSRVRPTAEPTLPTAQFASLVYGGAGVPLDDPAETFHEASRLYPNIAPERLDVLTELSLGRELARTASRSGRTHDHRPRSPCQGRCPFASGSATRSSGGDRCRPECSGRSVCASSQRSLRARTQPAAARERKCGGRYPRRALSIPLELYVLAQSVAGLEQGVYHYNPFRHGLSLLGPVDRRALRAALTDPTIADGAAAIVAVTAVFWRTRFKYGQRGYRFALLEAGHLVQNAVLATAQLNLPALPLGGFYDRRLDEIVGADGLDEASVHGLVLGGAA